jgi:metal-responsive CopG/Arc/MetJ family transcriptional regulator
VGGRASVDNVKKRLSFLIDLELLDRLRWIKTRTGLSDSEQIRRAIRMWLESREWPARGAAKRPLRDE